MCRAVSLTTSYVQNSGGHRGGVTPGSIPNPEVKPFSADGTARGTGWESRTPPDIFPLRAATVLVVALSAFLDTA